jgi:uncharacterized repeat protein (TIGR03803 family)
MRRIYGFMACCAVFFVCLAVAIAASAQTFTTLASFDLGRESSANPSGLVQGIDGNFYGVTTNFGATNSFCDTGCGTVFKVTPTGTLTILHTFCAATACTDGIWPHSLIRGFDGNFYGTTQFGGATYGSKTCPEGCGSVFKITPAGTLTTLYSFCSLANCADGEEPVFSLVQASYGGSIYGDFFGTTGYGGAFSFGTAFSLTPQGQLTTLHNFCAEANCADGYDAGALIQAVGGNFYGVADAGRNNNTCNGNCGIIFKMTPAGTLTTLHSFTIPVLPNSPLVEGTDGFFYGTTTFGGEHVENVCASFGCGTLYRVSSGGKLTALYDFCTQANCTDGNTPESGLIQSIDGNFYGATVGGPCAEANCGRIYTITSMGVFNTLYTFCAQSGCADGSGSQAVLVEGTDGKFYGTTYDGGSVNGGTVFSLDLGIAPFVSFLVSTGPIGKTIGIIGQGFTGTTAVSFNGTAATFTVKSDTYLTATVPTGATTGLVAVTTPSVTLLSNIAFLVTAP